LKPPPPHASNATAIAAVAAALTARQISNKEQPTQTFYDDDTRSHEERN
jgi:uncharacterized protein YoaH (UPF0181 family)